MAKLTQNTQRPQSYIAALSVPTICICENLLKATDRHSDGKDLNIRKFHEHFIDEVFYFFMLTYLGSICENPKP